MPTYNSANPVPIDSPFSKLLGTRLELAAVLGIPPIATNIQNDSNGYYAKAAAILGLDGSDPEYIARRVRHLGRIVRCSRFAASATWRSALPAIDILAPITDESSGLQNVSNLNSFLTYQLIKTGEPTDKKLFWRISTSGTTPNITAYVDDAPVASFSSNSGLLPIGQSGYSIRYLNSGGTGDAVRLYAELMVPYSGDCYPIYAAIKQNFDFVNQIAYSKSEYLRAIFTDGIVEDAIAAFILAVDEL